MSEQDEEIILEEEDVQAAAVQLSAETIVLSQLLCERLEYLAELYDEIPATRKTIEGVEKLWESNQVTQRKLNNIAKMCKKDSTPDKFKKASRHKSLSKSKGAPKKKKKKESGEGRSSRSKKPKQ